MGIVYNKKLVKKDRVISGSGPRDLQNKRNVPIPVNGNAASVSGLNKQISALTEQLSKAPVPQVGLYTSDQVNEEIEKAIVSETAQLKLEHERVLNEINVSLIGAQNEARTLKTEIAKLTAKYTTASDSANAELSKRSNEIKSKYDTLLEERDTRINTLEASSVLEMNSLKATIKSQDAVIESLKINASGSGVSAEEVERILAAATDKMERAAANMGVDMTDPDRPQMEEVFVDPLEKDAKELEHKIIVEDIPYDVKEVMEDKVSKLKSLMGSLPSR